jgi:hypothetical protein
MKKPKEKIKVQKSQIYYLNSDFYELKDLIATIQKLIREGWYGLTIGKIDPDMDYYDLKDFQPYVMLYCDRDETDDEYNQRVRLYEIYRENLKKTKLRRAQDKVELEQRERKLLEQLKNKYEAVD